MEITEKFQRALEQWLNCHWNGVENVQLEEGGSQPKGSGYSATTLILPVSFDRLEVGEKCRGQDRVFDKIVVRIESEGEPVYPQQTDKFSVEIELQYRSIKLLAEHSDVPVAPLIGYESDPAILGASFFVMGFIEGQVPIEHPLYTTEGFFVEASSEQRATLLKNGLKTLADIHAIDWQGAGVDKWLLDGKPGVAMQVNLWRDYTYRELAGRSLPVVDKAYDWLTSNIPDVKTISLCWGDSRPGNIIWDNFQCACVCDFENISITTPELDLGWWLMFDRYAHEAQGVDRLPGELSRAEQKDHYQQCAGRVIGDLYFYELFAAARYTALVVQTINRMVDSGDMPEDQTYWKENPVAGMLAEMIGERKISG